MRPASTKPPASGPASNLTRLILSYLNSNRVQINSITSYMDANFVYGSNYQKLDNLRTLHSGLMKTVNAFKEIGLKPLLPQKIEQPDDGCIRPTPGHYCFLAGDNRVNEQIALGVLHTVFVRVHNMFAEKLAVINPHWDDEKIYQETRHIIAAIVQHVTYGEFLPSLLGPTIMKRFGLNLKNEGYSNDYDPDIDVSIPASFGTAAFRFGHSLLPTVIERRSPSHHVIGEKRLREVLQQPYDLYKPGLIDQFILGMSNQLSQAMDDSITEEVTNHLFQEPRQPFGKDLAAINLVRAREHGIPGFFKYRELCGLTVMKDWTDMIPFFHNHTIKYYVALFNNPEDIDLWSAGVSEKAEKDSVTGPTFNCIIATTFRQVKRGDRFWYENKGWPSSFTPEQLAEIRKIRLSRLLCDGGDNIETIQLNAMEIPDYDKNPRVPCKGEILPSIDLNHWKEHDTNVANYLIHEGEITKGQEIQDTNDDYQHIKYGLIGSTKIKSVIVPELDKAIQEIAYINDTKGRPYFNGDITKVRPIGTLEHSYKDPPNKSWG